MSISGRHNLQRLNDIKTMLAAKGLSPIHRLGQNFLHDHNILKKLVDFADLHEGDIVVEIGPGTGTLTEELLSRGCKIIACELDHGLSELLQEKFGDQICLIHGDCLRKKQLNPEIIDAVAHHHWKLVANLPYQVASPLIVELLSHYPHCEGLYVTIQLEVAMRLMAKVDDDQWGVLSILAQRSADIELITKVSHSCFWPEPKVQSACVAITPRNEKHQSNTEEFSTFVTELFSKRRKQLGSIVGRETQLPEGIDPQSRPSTLTIDQLEALMLAVRTS